MVRKKDIDIEKIKELYSQGLIGKEIAEQLGCSISLVQTRLAAAGVKMLPSNRRKEVVIPKEVLEDLYWNQEKHPIQIGEIYGVSIMAVIKKMKKYGIPMRTKSEARVGKLNPIFGVGHSEATKEKMSQMFLDGRRKVSLTNQYGTATEYAGIVFKSRWEAAVAAFLDRTNVPFFYEKHSFNYINEKGQKRVYTPDFFLPGGVPGKPDCFYLEVKGCFLNRDQWKIDHCGVEVEVWNMSKLFELGIIDASGKVVFESGALKGDS